MYIGFIIFFIVVVLYIVFVPVRLVLQHPFLFIKYFICDTYNYFRHKKWNNFPCGAFTCYDSKFGVVFGSGKTLSVVNQTLKDFKKYDNKRVFDVHRRAYVTQKVHILSNLSLYGVPYEKLINLGQVLSAAENALDYDKKHDTLTCILVVIDECQNQLHCRSFKDNLSPMMLKALTECRHYNMSIYYDCPRFNQVDALLRQCTSINIKNRKLWRFQLQAHYDAFEVENCSGDYDKLKPIKKTGFFITDDLFNSYDTKEIIDTLSKARSSSDLLSDKEILDLQQDIKQKFIN